MRVVFLLIIASFLFGGSFKEFKKEALHGSYYLILNKLLLQEQKIKNKIYLRAYNPEFEAKISGYEANKRLNKKGIISFNDLEKSKIEFEKIKSKFNSLKLKLNTLNIDTKNLKKPLDSLIIYSHSSGKVSKIIVPLHTNVDPFSSLMEIVTNKDLYLIAYLSVQEALRLSKKIKAKFYLANHDFEVKFLEIMPKVDEETAQAKLLFFIEKKSFPLLIDAFGDIVIETKPFKKALTVKKSALSMLDGEWIVFVPKEHKKHSKSDEEDHEHTELNFEPKIVKVLRFLEEEAVIEGLKEGAEYVSSGVYILKSKLLKSKLGEHGH